jgi:hypothetical protein
VPHSDTSLSVESFLGVKPSEDAGRSASWCGLMSSSSKGPLKRPKLVASISMEVQLKVMDEQSKRGPGAQIKETGISFTSTRRAAVAFSVISSGSWIRAWAHAPDAFIRQHSAFLRPSHGLES